MKEEEQNNAYTYRSIDTSPPKKQLIAAIIHTELKKEKKTCNIKVKQDETRLGEGIKERLKKCSRSPLTFQIKGKGKVKQSVTPKAGSAQEK